MLIRTSALLFVKWLKTDNGAQPYSHQHPCGVPLSKKQIHPCVREREMKQFLFCLSGGTLMAGASGWLPAICPGMPRRMPATHISVEVPEFVHKPGYVSVLVRVVFSLSLLLFSLASVAFALGNYKPLTRWTSFHPLFLLLIVFLNLHIFTLTLVEHTLVHHTAAGSCM